MCFSVSTLCMKCLGCCILIKEKKKSVLIEEEEEEEEEVNAVNLLALKNQNVNFPGSLTLCSIASDTIILPQTINEVLLK